MTNRFKAYKQVSNYRPGDKAMVFKDPYSINPDQAEVVLMSYQTILGCDSNTGVVIETWFVKEVRTGKTKYQPIPCKPGKAKALEVAKTMADLSIVDEAIRQVEKDEKERKEKKYN